MLKKFIVPVAAGFGIAYFFGPQIINWVKSLTGKSSN